MKKLILMFVFALFCATGFAQKLTSESKDAMKAEMKKFEKGGWKGAGADADMKKAFERAYGYIQDTLNYVVVEAAAKHIDSKKAIGVATDIATKKAMEKARDVLRARGVKNFSTSDNFLHILTLYRNGKKFEDGGEGYVKVALKITQ